MLTRGFALIFTYSTPSTASWYAWKNGSSTYDPKNIISQNGGNPSSLMLVPPVNSSTNYSYWTFMSLGASDTPVAYEDANLVDPISTLTKVSSSFVAETSGSKTLLTYTMTVRNDTEAPITVKEIGVGGYHWATGATNTSGIMIARSVLDTPVTIGVGEMYSFTYTISLA